MKNTFLSVAGISFLTFTAGAATIATWTFESPNIPVTVTAASITGILPATGSGTASGFHADPNTTYSTAVGNGSANALSANHWKPGDYWEFHVSTIGFSGLQLIFAQTADSTGPTNFNLTFSLDGVTFTTAQSFYQVLANNSGGLWNSGSPNAATVKSVNLSSFTELNQAPDVFFRLTSNIGGPSASLGRIDNVQVTASVIPEPGNLVLAGLTLLLTSRLTRKRRSASLTVSIGD
jgi:hypothetical protein